ncbi:hypothetical protein UUU_03560 [Klebsiella pneumoniae subsp. pneumoniae DSM 30104 = JCM 1662 = NBRC 14940]|nr:hypothetical protein UUU_03560 [Klebsiella pneumoniae subsp. pneumoniae DSM 30104 = JCM 1662 = NBRC 14940]
MSLSSEQVIFYFVRSQRRYTIIVTLPPSLILNRWSFATDKKNTARTNKRYFPAADRRRNTCPRRGMSAKINQRYRY